MSISKFTKRLISTVVSFFSPYSLLSNEELHELVARGVISAHPSQINGSSIDITLDRTILLERRDHINNVVNLAKKENIKTIEHVMGDEGFTLHPGRFILASSVEMFNLPPNISAEYKLKSSMARNGLEHLNAGWCDAWWNNSRLTLEFKNMTEYHHLTIEPGMACGQIVFFKHKRVPKNKGYAVNGQYNHQEKVTASKGIRLGGQDAK